MGILKLKYTRGMNADGPVDYRLPIAKYNRFNPSILGLGDISKEGEFFEALAAVFDLSRLAKVF
jgi:hypothetical protein